MSPQKLQAVAIDGTVIMADKFKAEKSGLKLQRRKKQQSGSSGKQQSKSGSNGDKSGQSKSESGQNEGQPEEQGQEEEVIVLVPDEDEAGLETESDEVELTEKKLSEHESQKSESGQSKSKESGQSKEKKSGQSKGKKSGQSGKYETIGFIPKDRLMFVVPEQQTYSVEDLQEIAVSDPR